MMFVLLAQELEQGFAIQNLSIFLLSEGPRACLQPLVLPVLMASTSTSSSHSV